jgi:hypothetical protein
VRHGRARPCLLLARQLRPKHGHDGAAAAAAVCCRPNGAAGAALDRAESAAAAAAAAAPAAAAAAVTAASVVAAATAAAGGCVVLYPDAQRKDAAVAVKVRQLLRRSRCAVSMLRQAATPDLLRCRPVSLSLLQLQLFCQL